MALSDQNLTAGDPRDEQKLSRGNVGTVSDAATPAGTRTVSQESRGNVGTVGGILLAASLAMAPILEIPAAGGGITGTLSQTLAAVVGPDFPATTVGTGAVLVSGAATPTLAALTDTSSAGVLVSGTATPTLAPLTGSATAGALVSGTSAPTLGALTDAGSGAILVTGTATPTLAALQISATGTVSGGIITGTLSVTLGQLVLTLHPKFGFAATPRSYSFAATPFRAPVIPPRSTSFGSVKSALFSVPPRPAVFTA